MKTDIQEKSFEEMIKSFDESDISRYEPSKKLGEYFHAIKSNKSKSDDLEKVRKEIFLWDLSPSLSPEIAFNPMFIGKTEKGEDFEYPPLKTFDDTYVEHYKKRFFQTLNPRCKCRYGDILWQLKKDFSVVKDTIKSHRDCAKIYFENGWDLELCYSLIRAMHLSISIQDADSIRETYMFIEGIFKELIKKNSPRILIEIMDLLLNSKNKIDNLNYDFFIDASKKSIEIYKSKKSDSFAIQRSFYEIINKTGKAKGDEELSKKAIRDIFNSFIEEADWKSKNYPNGALIKASLLESALKYAYDNSDLLKEEVDRLKEDIQKNSSNVQEKVFKKVEVKITIPAAEIEKFIKIFEGKETVAILQAMAFESGIITSYEIARKKAEEQAKKCGLQHIMPPVRLYQRDLPIKTISTDEEKLEFLAIRTFMLGYRSGISALMPKVIDLIKKQDDKYLDNIIKFFEDAPLIEEENLKFLKEGLKHYFNEEYLACSHIFTFQVESILRNILKFFMVPTFSFRDGEMRVRMLDDVISALSSIKGFDQDFIKFLEIFLIDLRGENHRNRTAHGLCKYKYFDKNVCDLLFIILIRIASHRIIKNGDEEKKESST